MTKSGYITIVGLPNAGKSTLMNALIGEKISIITNKPQTTRKSILGILTDEDYQIIFLDTPGLLKPAYKLQEKMVEFVNQSVKDADIVVFMLDMEDDPEGYRLFNNPSVQEFVKTGTNKLLVLNKIDTINEEKLFPVIEKFTKQEIFKSVIPVSATKKFNLDTLKNELVELLPEGPKYYPDDQLSDAHERFFVSEIIREKIFELYKEEIPYSTEVIIEDFIERENKKDYVRALIILERDSQKPIIIGKGGEALKRLGKYSRDEAEKFLDREIYLELVVKVKPKWRTDEKILKKYGYSPGNE